MNDIEILRVLLALFVLVGIFSLPRRRKPAGILAGLFLLLLPFLPLDSVDAWIAGPGARAVGDITVIAVLAIFFTVRPHPQPDS